MRMMKKLAMVVIAAGISGLLLVLLGQVSPAVEEVLYGKPLRFDPDDGLAVLMVATILAPGALTAWLAELLAESRLGSPARALSVLVCNGLVTGALFGLFATLDDYFTTPGLEPTYALMGAAAGAVCGVIQWSILARMATRGGA
ncbi:hypothetical protein [Mycoplana rhizolycopersici]|uniref:Uncharacterized protein n=1 Tax=Mycoplana rhizolycopersici TaxID=2746702 RepID=A0ABX2QBI5_9HYPH|nr:hypothetical protein [Rhizobium rhizolycopersici]NVP54319.1 hypothetical protein [Rhizobium rhizolycopersici]